MRIYVFGVGSIGFFFGVFLVRVGNDVILIGWRE